MTTTIYPARRIITMNPAIPFAEAVAVRDGRVLAVGTVEELAGSIRLLGKFSGGQVGLGLLVLGCRRSVVCVLLLRGV